MIDLTPLFAPVQMLCGILAAVGLLVVLTDAAGPEL